MSMNSIFSRFCNARISRFAVVTLVALAWSSLAFCDEIHDAAKNGELEKVKALLKANPDLVNSKGTNSRTPLHIAAMHGHKDVAELLLSSGADVNARDEDLRTPLHLAAGDNQAQVILLLISNKADVNVRDYGGYTPLHYVSGTHDQDDVLKALLAHNAEVNVRAHNGVTPLHYVAASGSTSMMELLLTNKAEINAKETAGSWGNGWTPLHEAAWHDHDGAAGLLLAHGADVNAKGAIGETPLDLAMEWNYTVVANVLRQHGGTNGLNPVPIFSDDLFSNGQISF